MLFEMPSSANAMVEADAVANGLRLYVVYETFLWDMIPIKDAQEAGFMVTFAARLSSTLQAIQRVVHGNFCVTLPYGVHRTPSWWARGYEAWSTAARDMAADVRFEAGRLRQFGGEVRGDGE